MLIQAWSFERHDSVDIHGQSNVYSLGRQFGPVVSCCIQLKRGPQPQWGYSESN